MKVWIARLRRVIGLSSLIAVVPLLVLFAAPAAAAGSRYQYCTGSGSGTCLNQWNGGPNVN